MTDAITLPRSVVERALEALEQLVRQHYKIRTEFDDRAKALRSALEQPQVEQESVTRNGWVLREVLFDNGEPVGHREPQPPRQPLTEETIYDLWDERFRSWICGESFEVIVKAIERAHGIGGEA